MKSWYSSLLLSLGWGRIFLLSLDDLSGNIFSKGASGKGMHTSSSRPVAAWTSHQLHISLDRGAAVCHIGSTFYSHRGHSGFLDSIFHFFANHQTVCNRGNKIYGELSALWVAITISGWLQSSPDAPCYI